MDPKPGERCLDVTLGLGGHASELLRRVGERGELIGLDADERNLVLARPTLETLPGKLQLVHANFAELPRLQLSTFDVILADLGLSSPHLDDPTRGFSFRHDGPLDLRLDASRGEPASALLAKVEQEALTLALQRYGELRYAPKLAQILIAKPPTTTTELRARVVDWSGWRAPQLLPQVFQALRIWVNDELRALDTLLAWLPTGLNPGGRAACISFHSLEDRRVKHVLRDLSAPPIDPLTGKRGYAPFTLLTKHAIRPNDDEVKTNPRSRSALLRGIMKSS